MTGVHPDIGPELRKLAQSILDGIDPAVRLAASRVLGDGAGTGKCQQVWCPVCALAAVVSGEEHPLLTVIAEHSVALLAVIRALIDQVDGSKPPPGGGPGGSAVADTAADAGAPSRYQPISVTVEE
ncbi:hypothetical protein [Mycobacterium sp.]|uniref:hypothetical protein n=1 Tax=Mycobacterium sp. TaxID=1785 RepID=UPI003C764352